MNKEFVLALDQGTTSSRAVVFNRSGNIVSMAQKEFKQYFPKPGWVEHDPDEIWESQSAVMTGALGKAGLEWKDIAGIGIANQRETTVVWDRATGVPVHRAIVWQDRRTSDFCDRLKRQGLEDDIRRKTGLVIDPYFSATKIRWILDNVKDARRKAEQGDLAFGTIDSWLIWKLTQGKEHVTDVTNASRTMLWNIRDEKWDDDLLGLLGIPRNMMPEVYSSDEVYGVTNASVPGEGVPIAGMAGDQQAALFGQMCLQPGMIKNTYGTGAFLIFNTGDELISSGNNLLSTVAWRRGGRTCYALEGSIFVAGAVVQWLRDGLGIIRSSAEIEKLAQTVKDNGGVCFVPAFSGLGAPYWDPLARGTITGLTRGTSAGHLARAALESVAFQTGDVLRAMESDAGIKTRELRVDGGASVNDTLMQFQADILGIPLVRPKIRETTALGAAYLSGLATGFWKDIGEIRNQWEVDKRFEPRMPASEVARLMEAWHEAVEKAKSGTPVPENDRKKG